MFHLRLTSVLIAASGLALSAVPSSAIISLHLPGSGFHMGGGMRPMPKPPMMPKPMPKPPMHMGGWGGGHWGGGYGGGHWGGGYGGGHWGGGYGGGHWGGGYGGHAGWGYHRPVLGSHPMGMHFYGMGGGSGMYGGNHGYGHAYGSGGGQGSGGGSLYARYSASNSSLMARYGGGNLAARYGSGYGQPSGYGSHPTSWGTGGAGSKSFYRSSYSYASRYSSQYRYSSYRYSRPGSWGYSGGNPGGYGSWGMGIR